MEQSILFLVGGVFSLYFGAERLVRGSSSLALRMGMSPLVVGLTVVAFGTSMPELIVSIKAGFVDNGAIAIGNVVGSNIFNIAVILGITACIYPLHVQLQLVRFDVPIMIFSSLLFLLFFGDREMGRLEGALLFSLLVFYTLGNLYFARKESLKKDEGMLQEAIPKQSKHFGVDLLFIAGGFGLLIAGAHFFVEGAMLLARRIGISEALIGLTIVAGGTSLPELATSLVAAMKKEADIAIGNIVGSNIFNILCILGVVPMISPIDGEGINSVDIFIMIGTAAALLPILKTDFLLDRKEGSLLLVVYIAYIYYLLHR